MNPQIQSSVHQNNDQFLHLHEPMQNGISYNLCHMKSHENRFILNVNSGEKHTNHHHIQVEPTSTLKRPTSTIKSPQIIDVQPTVIVQHQRPTSSSSRPNSAATVLLPTTNKDPLNEAYIDRNNNRAQVLIVESTNTNTNDNDSTSTLKQHENQQERTKNPPHSTTPPPSPSNKEFNRLWRRQRNKHSFKVMTAAVTARKNPKSHRPPARLKNYGDDSDSETTATETNSKDEGKFETFLCLYRLS